MDLPALIDSLSWRLRPGYYLWKARGVAYMRPEFHRAAVRAVQRLIRDHDVGAQRASRLSVDANDCAEKLRRDGFVRLGAMLNAEEIAKLTAFYDSVDARDPWAPSKPSFPGRTPPATAHTGQYYRSTVIQSPFVLELANDPTVLRIAKSFLGATPTLSDLNAWWSYVGPERAKEAQLYHRDRDDLKFCKLFIYLTDVDMTTGPHVYVRGSNNDPRMREERRFTDDEVEAAFGKDHVEYFCEPAGSAFIVDTSGLHKGLLPTKGRRLIYESHYSLLPIGNARYERDEKVSVPPDYPRYVNRLLVRS